MADLDNDHSAHRHSVLDSWVSAGGNVRCDALGDEEQLEPAGDTENDREEQGEVWEVEVEEGEHHPRTPPPPDHQDPPLQQ